MLRTFVIVLGLLNVGVLLAAGIPFSLAIVPTLIIGGGFTVWGAATVSSNYFMKVWCKGPATEKAVALTFDDGPVEGQTDRLLDILKTHEVPAAFFCIGRRVEQAPLLMKRIQEEGHLIGNHTWSHSTLFDLNFSGTMKKDLQKANDAIYAATGLKPLLFRPPYGVTNPALASAVKAGGYTPIGWSIRSLDTAIKDEDKLLERVSRKITNGDIFLFHDTSDATARILPCLIKQLRREGYVIKRVDELLKVKAYV
ncbi:polysaccharide deacetylase family protein [Chitinophaga lutea]